VEKVVKKEVKTNVRNPIYKAIITKIVLEAYYMRDMIGTTVTCSIVGLFSVVVNYDIECRSGSV
jgi:hypothetical protein